MGRIIAVANQKGGVGKTTTSVNLASALSEVNKKVLLIDLDPQGNASMGSGVDKYELGDSAYEVLMDSVPIRQVMVASANDQYKVLPSNTDLTAAEVGLMNVRMKEKRLQLALSQIESEFDYIIIDCPPSLSMLTINALVASHSVLVPLQTEYYALEGLSGLINTIEQIRKGYNERLELEGILRTMHDPRNRLAGEVSGQLIQHFGDKVFRTIIPRNVRVAEAPSHGQPVLLYDKYSRGAVSYMGLASELLRRHAQAASLKG